MTRRPFRVPKTEDLVISRADLRDLQHRLGVVERQPAFLIDAKLIEIDRLKHLEVGEALGRIAKNKGGPWS